MPMKKSRGSAEGQVGICLVADHSLEFGDPLTSLQTRHSIAVIITVLAFGRLLRPIVIRRAMVRDLVLMS